MEGMVASSQDTGLEVIDLEGDPAFLARRLHTRDAVVQMDGMRRLAGAFVDHPETILQELVEAAVHLCGADSAGISVEQEDGTDERFYRWIATAGEYAGFSLAQLPRYPSACGVCLERGRPQLFRVKQRFFDVMGIDAAVVTDGILLPWQVDETRGTIWIMAHGRTEAFDQSDSRMMQILADFAAMGVRQQRQQKALLERASVEAAAAMAHQLAHGINNPLQGLTNTLYLAMEGHHGDEVQSFAENMSHDFEKLTKLVEEFLALPRRRRESAAQDAAKEGSA